MNSCSIITFQNFLINQFSILYPYKGNFITLNIYSNDGYIIPE